jgi:hypothetical protein
MAKNRRGSSREDLLNPYAAIDSTVPCIARSRERRHDGQTTGRQVVWPPHAQKRSPRHRSLRYPGRERPLLDRGRAHLDRGDIACALAVAAQANRLASETAMRWSYGVMPWSSKAGVDRRICVAPRDFGGQFVIFALTM